jgi:hypothetical protein
MYWLELGAELEKIRIQPGAGLPVIELQLYINFENPSKSGIIFSVTRVGCSQAEPALPPPPGPYRRLA